MTPPHSNAGVSLDAESQRLEQALLELIAEAPAGFVELRDTLAASYGLDEARYAELDARFERLAVDLFAYQYERVPAYRAWSQQLGRTPDCVERADRVPALPAEAWREARLATFPAQHARMRFETSGTTSQRPGVLLLDSLALYDAALERGFVHHVLPDREQMRMLLLVPEPRDMPHSSLAYMLQRVRQRFGTDESAVCGSRAGLDAERARQALTNAAAAGEPVCILGTAFALVQLLDACDALGWSIALPEGSRLFETGGYKGRTRALARDALYAALEHRLGIPVTHMVSEYGMTELGSQYYTLSLRRTLVPSTPDATVERSRSSGAWSAPFWLRAHIVDPESGQASVAHEARGPGLLLHHDLANRGSVARLLCADVGRPLRASFTLHGRAPRSELRGCGLVAESWPTSGERPQ